MAKNNNRREHHSLQWGNQLFSRLKGGCHRYGIFINMLAMISGCTRTITFKVVDALTLQPISSARASIDLKRISMVFPYRHERRLVGLTSRGGVISVDGIPTVGQWQSHVLFEHPGFFNADCAYQFGDIAVLQTRVSTDIDSGGQIQNEICVRDDEVIVKMFSAPK